MQLYLSSLAWLYFTILRPISVSIIKSLFILCFSLPNCLSFPQLKQDWFLQLASSFYSCMSTGIVPDKWAFLEGSHYSQRIQTLLLLLGQGFQPVYGNVVSKDLPGGIMIMLQKITHCFIMFPLCSFLVSP